MDLCSKCNNDLDTTGSPKWCRACRAQYHREYQRDYKETKLERAAGKGFADGAEEMRRAILSGLGGMNPGGMLRVAEVANWIAGVDPPRP